MNQLNVYTEEKLDDDAEMRERTRGMMRRTVSDAALSDAENVMQDIVRLAQEHGKLYPVMVDILLLHKYSDVLGKDVELQLKADLLMVLDKFVEQAAMLDKFDDSWHIFMFMKRFVASVSHITGQELEVKAAFESDYIVEEELESLRTKVEELNDEGGSQGKPPGKGGPESFHGVVQRLVQEEKQVLQLQSELDRIKGQQQPNEVRDADERVKQARDRSKWNTLMDEIAKLKVKNGEAETLLGIKDKEIVYLKCMLEFVYSRFSAREEHREEAREAKMDAELVVTRTIEMADLKAQVANMKAKLEAKPKTEKEFKAHSPPPPPPPSKPKRTSTAPTHVSLAVLSNKTPPPPPPPSAHPARSPSIPIAVVTVLKPTSSTPLASSTLPLPPPSPPTAGIPVSAASTGPPLPPPPPPLSSSSAPPPPPPPQLLGVGLPIPPPPPTAFRMGSNKINNSTVSNTVWHEVPTGIELDLNDLETTFTIDNSTPTPSQLQDITRANHIAIMLKRIKLNFLGIRQALLELNDDLSIDDLRAIGKHLLTPDEVNRIKDFGNMADQYFSQIISIPRLSERLDCMLYRQLHGSIKFRQILQAVLAVGNALNESSFWGGAQGFQLKLEAFLKLAPLHTFAE
ncbi:hypothetical protein IW261DRAFT_1641921 [Armillaria novae-zelandiae]|uniref:FH2 domain-containing protein n=1 Tax=Armillaria novae-zelandiae TaxID=153914 RepID=A0AA39TAK7_9AGAR|nr:hypothetical protein IW261DRAFT_1641921 [Armillaria novae-zelandiae]